jgi:hypothetical protein
LHPDQTHDGFERGGFAGAIAAQQTQHFAGVQIEGKVVQDLHFAIKTIDVVDD